MYGLSYRLNCNSVIYNLCVSIRFSVVGVAGVEGVVAAAAAAAEAVVVIGCHVHVNIYKQIKCLLSFTT